MKNKILIIGSNLYESALYLSPMYRGDNDIIIGNAEGIYLSKNSIFETLEDKIDALTRIDIIAHGSVEGSEHYLRLDKFWSTREVLREIVKYAKGNEVHISIHSCHSGAAINLIEDLPLESTLVTYSDPHDVTSTALGDFIFSKSIETYQILNKYFENNSIHYYNFSSNLALNILAGHCIFAIKEKQVNKINFTSDPLTSPIVPYYNFLKNQPQLNSFCTSKKFMESTNKILLDEIQEIISSNEFLYYLSTFFYNAYELEDNQLTIFLEKNSELIKKYPSVLVHGIGSSNILGITTHSNKLSALKNIILILDEFLSNNIVDASLYNSAVIPAVHIAIQENYITALKILTNNSTFNIDNYNIITGNTALIKSLKSMQSTFDYMLKQEPDIHKAHALTWDTPLIIAIKIRSPHIVEELLKKGADINLPHPSQSYCPFFLALIGDYIIGNDTMKTLLINYNVDLNSASANSAYISDSILYSLITDLMLNYSYLDNSKFRYVNEAFEEVKNLSISDYIAYLSLPYDFSNFDIADKNVPSSHDGDIELAGAIV